MSVVAPGITEQSEGTEVTAVVPEVRHRYHWAVTVIAAVEPPKVAGFPEIEVVEFIAGELGLLIEAELVSVGAGPTGPSDAE